MGILKSWIDSLNKSGVNIGPMNKEEYPLLTVSRDSGAVQQLEIIKAYSYPCNCGYTLVYPIPEIDEPAVIQCDLCGTKYSMTWKGDHFLSHPMSQSTTVDRGWLAFKERHAADLAPRSQEEWEAKGIEPRVAESDSKGVVTSRPALSKPAAHTADGGFGPPPNL